MTQNNTANITAAVTKPVAMDIDWEDADWVIRAW